MKVPKQNIDLARTVKDSIGDDFSEVVFKKKSCAAAGLAVWVINIITYYDEKTKFMEALDKEKKVFLEVGSFVSELLLAAGAQKEYSLRHATAGPKRQKAMKILAPEDPVETPEAADEALQALDLLCLAGDIIEDVEAGCQRDPVVESPSELPDECLMPREMLLDVLQAEKAEVEDKVGAEERVLRKQADNVRAAQLDAQRDLDIAMPALEKALTCLDAVSKKHICEIKAFMKPPPLVMMTMEAVNILLEQTP